MDTIFALCVYIAKAGGCLFLFSLVSAFFMLPLCHTPHTLECHSTPMEQVVLHLKICKPDKQTEASWSHGWLGARAEA